MTSDELLLLKSTSLKQIPIDVINIVNSLVKVGPVARSLEKVVQLEQN